MSITITKSIKVVIVLAVILSGCSVQGSLQKLKRPAKEAPTVADASGEIAPKMRADSRKPPQNLGKITVANAAKVTDAELQEAVAKPDARLARDLGKTVASLGLIGETGFWLQTPLVQSETDGRVVYLKNGKSINLRLVPNGAVAGSGSQISIAAMKTLGISIVDLAELQVFTR